jgi:hypothetical protein
MLKRLVSIIKNLETYNFMTVITVCWCLVLRIVRIQRNETRSRHLCVWVIERVACYRNCRRYSLMLWGAFAEVFREVTVSDIAIPFARKLFLLV